MIMAASLSAQAINSVSGGTASWMPIKGLWILFFIRMKITRKHTPLSVCWYLKVESFLIPWFYVELPPFFQSSYCLPAKLFSLPLLSNSLFQAPQMLPCLSQRNPCLAQILYFLTAITLETSRYVRIITFSSFILHINIWIIKIPYLSSALPQS